MWKTLSLFIIPFLIQTAVYAQSVEDVVSEKMVASAFLDRTGQYLILTTQWREKNAGDWEDQTETLIYDLRTNQSTSLPVGCTALSWTPDESKVLLKCPQKDTPGVSHRICRFSPKTGACETITGIPQGESFYKVSLTGKNVLYSHDVPLQDTRPLGHPMSFRDSSLYSLPPFNDFEKVPSLNFISNDVGFIILMTWAPDDTSALITSSGGQINFKGIYQNALYLYNNEDQTIHALDTHVLSSRDIIPSLSLKGDFISFTSKEGKIQYVNVLTKEGKSLIKIPFGEGATWISNTQLLYSKRKEDLYQWFLYDTHTHMSEPTPLTTSSSSASYSFGNALTFINEDWDVPPYVHMVSYDSVTDLISGTYKTQDFKLPHSHKAETLDVRHMQWKSTDGMTVHGTLMYPKNYKPGLKYPLLILLADEKEKGFTRTYLGHINPALNRVPSLYAREGWFVLMPNVRGSYGYDPSFADMTPEDVGELDCHDFLTAIDALNDEGLIDMNHVALFGKGYGGYLALMAGIQHPDLFQAISTSDAYTHWLLQAASSVSDSVPREWLGPYDTSAHLWQEKSPSMHVEKIQTPVRMEGNSSQYLITRDQMELMAYLLKRFGKKVEAYALSGNYTTPTAEALVNTLKADIVFLKDNI